jgi:hypothetical protein
LGNACCHLPWQQAFPQSPLQQLPLQEFCPQPPWQQVSQQFDFAAFRSGSVVWANATALKASIKDRKPIVRFMDISFTLKMQKTSSRQDSSGILVAASFA